MQLTITSPPLSVLILPNCGPDMKYFLAFARTQLSTSITMILVFGPKFRRLLNGTGDDAGERHKRWQLTSVVSTVQYSTVQCRQWQSLTLTNSHEAANDVLLLLFSINCNACYLLKRIFQLQDSFDI